MQDLPGYDIMSAKEKGSGCEADIYFSCAINERIAMRSRARSAIARIRECESEVNRPTEQAKPQESGVENIMELQMWKGNSDPL